MDTTSFVRALEPEECCDFPSPVYGSGIFHANETRGEEGGGEGRGALHDIPIAQNAYCSRDIYLQFTKYLRSVILPSIIQMYAS